MNSCRVKTGNAKNSWRISWRHVLPEKMHFSKRWYPGFSPIPLSQVTRKSATFGRAVRIVASAEAPDGLSPNTKPHASNVYIRSSA